MDPGEVLVGNGGGKKVMEAVNGLDQILRRLATACYPDLRSADENPGHFSRRYARLPGGVDSRLDCRMKRVCAGHELDGHMSDNVPFLAKVAHQLLGVHLAAAKDC